MGSLPYNYEHKLHEHIHDGHVLRIPGIHIHHSRHRSDSFPSPPLPTPPQIQQSFTDMAQRSAAARARLGKLTVPPTSASSHQKTSRKPSFSFNTLFSTPDASSTSSKRRTYLPDWENALSNSSLPLVSPVVGPMDRPVVVPSSVPDALRILQVEHAAVLAQNAELRAELVAEKAISAKLCCYLQEYHESQGRTNPEKGNLNSVFYRNLKDEQGNSLIPPEMVNLDSMAKPLPCELMGGEWVSDTDGEEEADKMGIDEMRESMGMREQETKADERRWKLQYARSFESQRA